MKRGEGKKKRKKKRREENFRYGNYLCMDCYGFVWILVSSISRF